MKRIIYILVLLMLSINTQSCTKDPDVPNTVWGQSDDDDDDNDDEFTYDYDIELIEGVYRINSTNGLCAFRDLVNGDSNTSEATFSGFDESEFGTTHPAIDGKVMTNINLATIENWTPIGLSNSTPFGGTFDGNKKYISNLKIIDYIDYVGLFGYVYGGSISNITLKNSTVMGPNCVGTLCAYLISQDSDVFFENCFIEDGVVSGGSYSGTLGIGGVIGRASTGSFLLTIKNCYNTGSVTGASAQYTSVKVGGIIGLIWNTSNNITITDCYNTGYISGNSSSSSNAADSYAYAGGIVGYTYTSYSLTIESCYNNGSISGSSENGGVRFGGITGYAYSLDYADLAIKDCYNTGLIQGIDIPEDTFAGGIVGYARVSSNSSISITSCNSSGSISGSAGDWVYIGGVVGYSDTTADSSTMAISNCYNTVDITGSSPDWVFAGGVVGRAYSSSSTSSLTITDSYNTGETTNGYTANGSLIGCATGDNNIYGLTACYYLDTWGKSAIGQNLAGYSEPNLFDF